MMVERWIKINDKVIIEINDKNMDGTPCTFVEGGRFTSVRLTATNYGGSSPCINQEEINDSVSHFKEWAVREGDKPIVRDNRECAKLSAFF